MNLQIVFIDSKQSTLDNLAAAFVGLKGFEIAKVDQVRYHSPAPGLDALFLTVTAAERWGSRPIPGGAQVLRTVPQDWIGGMPRFVVAGGVLLPAHPRNAAADTKLVVTAAMRAVEQFNAAHTEKISRLGFWAVNLLDGVSPEQLMQIFREVSSGEVAQF